MVAVITQVDLLPSSILFIPDIIGARTWAASTTPRIALLESEFHALLSLLAIMAL